jgi:hypothetical protein
MMLHPNAVRLFFCLGTLALGLVGMKVPAVKRVCAYGSAILILIYVCSLAGVALASFFDRSNYIAAAIGFFSGVALAVVLGVPLGRAAINQSWLYWLLIAAVALIIPQLKPLIKL